MGWVMCVCVRVICSDKINVGLLTIIDVLSMINNNKSVPFAMGNYYECVV